MTPTTTYHALHGTTPLSSHELEEFLRSEFQSGDGFRLLEAQECDPPATSDRLRRLLQTLGHVRTRKDLGVRP